MKKIIILLLGIISIFIFTGCNSSTTEDALKFKEEYESLNGQTREKDGKEIRTISIPDNNPMIYKEANDIVSLMDNKETFLVYFGFSDCPWCRSVIPYLIEEAKNNNIKKIYYVDVKEIRDVLSISEEGKVIIDKEGTEGYYNLLKKLDNVLSDYNLVDSEGNKIDTNEKRIYAPNIVVVKDGKAITLTSGISEKQTNGYMELTDEMIEDMKNNFDNIIKILDK